MFPKLSLIAFLLVCSLKAQTPLVVGGTSSNWTGISTTPAPNLTTYMADPIADRQTGQGSDDFVGSTTNPGFFVNLGTVNGIASIGFRSYMSEYTAAGYAGNYRVGIDANKDGAIDIFIGPKLSGAAKSQGIIFQNATGAGNYSPSTTALGNPYGLMAISTSNYDYQSVTATLDPTWVTVGTGPNASLSFDLPVQTLKDNLAAMGIIITDQTELAFIAFTSTQANAINQDLYGSTGIVNSARFDGPSGGLSDYYSLDGSYRARPIVPETTFYGFALLSMLMLVVGIRSYKTYNINL